MSDQEKELAKQKHREQAHNFRKRKQNELVALKNIITVSESPFVVDNRADQRLVEFEALGQGEKEEEISDVIVT